MGDGDGAVLIEKFLLLLNISYDNIGFPDGSDGKESTCNAGYPGSRFSPWVEKILWRREWLPTPLFLPRRFHGQESPVGYRGSKELVGHV